MQNFIGQKQINSANQIKRIKLKIWQFQSSLSVDIEVDGRQ